MFWKKTIRQYLALPWALPESEFVALWYHITLEQLAWRKPNSWEKLKEAGVKVKPHTFHAYHAQIQEPAAVGIVSFAGCFKGN